MILSNPRKRSRRRNMSMTRNPLHGLNLKSIVSKGMTFGGGAAIAVGANALFLNGISNFWARNGARFGGAVLTAGFLKGDLGASAAGAMFYPLMQELAAKFIGTKTVAATEADLEGLAADLEDVMGELDESDLSDDEMEISDDEDFLS
jgi:hypothetical protein